MTRLHALAAALLLAGLGATQPAPPAGAQVGAAADASAYSRPVPGLSPAQAEHFALGHRMFNNKWAFYWFEHAEWGRGPTSNAQSCATCHARNGRGLPPDADGLRSEGAAAVVEELLIDSHIHVRAEPALHLVVRVSLPGDGPNGAPRPHPHYGDQLQNFGVRGVVPAEADVRVRWRTETRTLADGETVEMRAPVLALERFAYGPLGEDVMLSLRLAPPLIGAGLLEAVPDETLEALARAPAGEGVHGRLNRVWDPERQATVIGRFGLKANHPGLREQVAAAFLNDLGLSSPLYPAQNCPPVQRTCAEQMVAGRPEISELRLAATVFYLSALEVPARRGADEPQVQRGEALFRATGCSTCHLPELRTGEVAGAPFLSNQLIHPYTDLLLHDMGEGLADGRPDFAAGAREWRTAPLWGIGLSETVNGSRVMLHDGRARSFAEAILWHGGEAASARERFSRLPREDREALYAFLRSL